MNPEFVEISDDRSHARIALHGGELVSWRAGGIELIWTPDATIWDRTSPVLFPVVGWCRDGQIRVGGESYPMGVHGFAAHCSFEMTERTSSQVTLLLRDSAATRVHYPFVFELAVTYAFRGASLCIELTVRNTGKSDVPYACGVHPGFRWPFAGGAREDYRIEFQKPERPEVPVIAPGGLFSDEMRPIQLHSNVLQLTGDTFAREALCFLNARSTSLAIVSAGGVRLAAEFENFPHIALWSKQQAPFLCVEAWTGHGDPAGFAGELADKPSMLMLAPKTEGRHRAAFSFG